MTAADIMCPTPITINQDKSVKEAAELMVEKQISVLPVVDGEKVLVGVLTQSDFVGKAVDIPHAVVSLKQLFGQNFNLQSIEEVYKQSQSKVIKDVMSTNLKTVSPESSVDSVVDLMIKNNLKRIPVVVNNNLVGIITRRNILKAFVKA